MTVQLPIDSYLSTIVQRVEVHHHVIISAAPGAGKSTRVPVACMQKFSDRNVIVLQPRRLAAKMLALRTAQEIGSTCGAEVGFITRSEQKISSATRLLFVTEGILVRMLLEGDHRLARAVIILDEFHERSLNSDLSVAMLRVTESDPKIDRKIVVMSATLDIGRLQTYFGADCAHIEVPGKTFPVEIFYLPEADSQIERHAKIKLAIDLARSKSLEGHILVFLTGQRDILRLNDMLTQSQGYAQFDICPLFADADAAAQQKIFENNSQRRKIILSTNVAETSLTIPGVRAVVDSGLAKISGFSKWSGMQTLDERRVSQASCIQRGGRAGREAPGLVARCFSERDFLSRAKFSVPEVHRTDVSGVCLQAISIAAKFGLSFAEFPWFEAPDSESIDTAIKLLKDLGAIDASATITERGFFILSLPLSPRLAAVAEKAKSVGNMTQAIAAVALISEGIRVTGHGFLDAVEELRGDQKNSRSQQNLSGARQLYQQLLRKVDDTDTLKNATEQDLIFVLLAGFYDRIAKKIADERTMKAPRWRYYFCLGGGGSMARGHFHEAPEYILVLDARESEARSGAEALSIEQAMAINVETLLDSESILLTRQNEDRFDEVSGVTESWSVTKYGSLVLKETRLSKTTTTDEDSLFKLLKKNWPHPFNDDEPLRKYHARINLIKKSGFDLDFPEFHGEMFDLLLHAMVDGKSSLKEIDATGLEQMIYEQLSFEQTQELDLLAPKYAQLKNGKKFLIDYRDEGTAMITGFVQDFYGLKEDPFIAKGRVKLTCTFLAPNKRAVQTSTGVQSFFSGAYHEVRREFQRRYPRHYWPENPMEAEPRLHIPRKK